WTCRRWACTAIRKYRGRAPWCDIFHPRGWPSRAPRRPQAWRRAAVERVSRTPVVDPPRALVARAARRSSPEASCPVRGNWAHSQHSRGGTHVRTRGGVDGGSPGDGADGSGVRVGPDPGTGAFSGAGTAGGAHGGEARRAAAEAEDAVGRVQALF